jgi:hypothetical protein
MSDNLTKQGYKDLLESLKIEHQHLYEEKASLLNYIIKICEENSRLKNTLHALKIGDSFLHY